MPGVVWDVKEKRVRVFQTLDDTLALHELKNFTIIRDPSAPFPAGRAYCLPAYHIIGAIDHANKAADQQVHRVGAPLIFPQITETITADLKTWGDNFVRTWGKDTGFVIPPAWRFQTSRSGRARQPPTGSNSSSPGWSSTSTRRPSSGLAPAL